MLSDFRGTNQRRMQCVAASIVEPMADAARQRATEHVEMTTPPVTSRTAPVGLPAAARALLPLNPNRNLAAADDKADVLAREVAQGRARRGRADPLHGIDEPLVGSGQSDRMQIRFHQI